MFFLAIAAIGLPKLFLSWMPEEEIGFWGWIVVIVLAYGALMYSLGTVAICIERIREWSLERRNHEEKSPEK